MNWKPRHSQRKRNLTKFVASRPTLKNKRKFLKGNTERISEHYKVQRGKRKS